MTTAFLDRTSGALSPDVRKRLERVIANPTQRTWDDAYSIILDQRDHTTLWQAWIAVDSDAPRVGRTTDANGRTVKEWPRIPDQLTLYRAIRHATGK